MYGGDCIEKLPYPSERYTSALHIIALVSMGLPILDWPALTELAETCNQQKRWDFLPTTAPLRLQGGTSSPLNPPVRVLAGLCWRLRREKFILFSCSR